MVDGCGGVVSNAAVGGSVVGVFVFVLCLLVCVCVAVVCRC